MSWVEEVGNLERELRHALTEYLATFLTSKRKGLIEEVLAQRTRHLTLVMEDIDKPHNAGAVLRTADCFGIQDVHIIEESTPYKHSQKITRGSSKWLTLHRYGRHQGGNTEQCFHHLHASGYKVYVTSPAASAVGFEHIDFSSKVAVLFGTEWAGATPYAMQHADGYIKLPMYGFTESFNISVAAALTLQGLTERLRMAGVPWQLSEEELAQLRYDWYCNSVRHPEALVKGFLDHEGKDA